ncbi:large-conductance mechanosensitive channel protein MscL [Serratia symbiotica]|nr:large-conductance mechanosensitive channel protein MscL [Serratia symbiotica]
MRGNVVYLALGVIISVAFGKIVSSLVADIIMLPLGLLIGSVNFKQLHLVLREAQGTVPAVVINYGLFIQTIFDFVIVAFAIFLAIKLMKKARHKQEEKPVTPPAPTAEEKLLTEIRDLLSQQQPKL